MHKPTADMYPNFCSKENLRKAVLQNVIKEILRCDYDRDGLLNRKEAAVLATSIQVGLAAYGIVFDVDKFHRAIGLSPTLFSAVAIVKRLIPDKDDKLASFYSDVESIAESYRSEVKQEAEQETLFDMFYMPIRRRFEGSLANTLYSVKDNPDGQKYMSLSPRSSFTAKACMHTLHEGVSPCPECAECPYCIAKSSKSTDLDGKSDKTIASDMDRAHEHIP